MNPVFSFLCQACTLYTCPSHNITLFMGKTLVAQWYLNIDILWAQFDAASRVDNAMILLHFDQDNVCMSI